MPDSSQTGRPDEPLECTECGWHPCFCLEAAGLGDPDAIPGVLPGTPAPEILEVTFLPDEATAKPPEPRTPPIVVVSIVAFFLNMFGAAAAGVGAPRLVLPLLGFAAFWAVVVLALAKRRRTR